MEESGRAHAQAGGGGGESSRKGKRAASGGGGPEEGKRGKQRKGMGSGGGSRREGSDGDVCGVVAWEDGSGGELPGEWDYGLRKRYAIIDMLLRVLIVFVLVFVAL
jgi:hypothetical protein